MRNLMQLALTGALLMASSAIAEIPSEARYIIQLKNLDDREKLINGSFKGRGEHFPAFRFRKPLGAIGFGEDLISATSEDPYFCQKALEEDFAIECHQEFPMQLHALPNDPLAPDQWGNLNADGIQANAAWNTVTGDPAQIVAVFDTGIDTDHPDLVGNMWVNFGEIPGNAIDDDGNGWTDDRYGINPAYSNWPSFGNGNVEDMHGHGTHIAGIIGAVGNNLHGITGVNQDVTLYTVKAMDDSGNFWPSNVITGLNHIYSMKVWGGVNFKVVNMSFGNYVYDAQLHNTISYGSSIGIIFVASAGNNGSDNDITPMYPASYNVANLISVGAVNKNTNLTAFSNHGNGSGSVDIAAPGKDILSTGRGGSWYNSSGTSQAAAFVSGAIALLYDKNPSLHPNSAAYSALAHSDYYPQLNGYIGMSALLNVKKMIDNN